MPEPLNVEAEAQLPLEQFISRGNARDRGEEVKPLPEPKVASDSDAPGEPLGTEAAPVSDVGEPAIAAADEPKPEVKPKKARNDAQARVEEATAKEAAAKREAAEAKAEAARLAAELAALKAPKPAAAPVATAADKKRYLALDGAPQLKDYQDYEDYNADVAAFVGQQVFRENMAAYRAEEQDRTRRTAYQTRLEQAQVADPTLATVIAGAGDLQISLPMRDVVLDSAIGPQLLKYFIEHPSETQRLSTLPPDQVFRSLGRLEEQLTPRTDAARPTGPAPSPVISQAHAPISPVRATPATSDDDGDDDSISVEEHIRRENAKDRARASVTR